MKHEHFIEELINRFPKLEDSKKTILEAFNLLTYCFKNKNKLLIAGNGGSCADSEHIVGELMKGFKKKRIISDQFANLLISIDEKRGKLLSQTLQQGLPCISLTNHQGLNTAFINDIDNGGEYIFAQQLNVLGNTSDVFLAISTSGNSKNIINACVVAKAKNMKIIGLTGENGGVLKDIADVCIKAPSNETFIIQEYHQPIYHCLCLMLEEYFF